MDGKTEKELRRLLFAVGCGADGVGRGIAFPKINQILDDEIEQIGEIEGVEEAAERLVKLLRIVRLGAEGLIEAQIVERVRNGRGLKKEKRRNESRGRSLKVVER